MSKFQKVGYLPEDSKAKISALNFLIYSPISIFAVLGALISQLDKTNILEALGIGFIITASTGVLILISNLVFGFLESNYSPNLSDFYKFINAIFCGAGRGFIMFYLIAQSNFEQPSPIEERVLSSTANFLFWTILIDKVIQENRRFGKKYRSLISASILKLAADYETNAQNRLLANWEEEFEEIQSLLNRTLSGVDLNNFRAEKLVTAANSLREIIDQRVRPLSHRLWASSTNSVPRVQFQAILGSTLKYPVIPAAQLAVSISAISAVNLVSTFGPTRGIASAIFILILYFGYFQVLHKRLLKIGKGGILRGLLSLAYPAVIASTVFYFVNAVYYKEYYGLFNLVVMFNFILITCSFAFYEVNRIDRENVLIEIERGVSELLKNQQTSRNTREEQMASYLHNALQPEILALSHQLEEAAQTSDVTETKDILERVASKLNRSLYEEFPSSEINVLERLNRIQNAWKGLVDVQLELSEDFVKAIQQNFLVTQIVDEAIANSVRHQSARKVVITGSLNEENQPKLLILSRGFSNPSIGAGLGSEWLDRYFKNRWARRVNGDETVLEIEL